MKKYDALIIGFGKGGKTLAAALGKKGPAGRPYRTITAHVRRHLHQYWLYPHQKAYPHGRRS